VVVNSDPLDAVGYCRKKTKTRCVFSWRFWSYGVLVLCGFTCI